MLKADYEQIPDLRVEIEVLIARTSPRPCLTVDGATARSLDPSARRSPAGAVQGRPHAADAEQNAGLALGPEDHASAHVTGAMIPGPVGGMASIQLRIPSLTPSHSALGAPSRSGTARSAVRSQRLLSAFVPEAHFGQSRAMGRSTIMRASFFTGPLLGRSC